MARERTVREAKRRLRFQLLANRARRSSSDRAAAADALSARLGALPEVVDAGCVACYVSTAEEPGTAPLLSALSARGCQILLPLLQPDFDLSWALYQAGALQEARFGISEPTGERLGPGAVEAASVVICPALAADGDGHRLGRGGGSYDRVLARLAPTTFRVALLYDDEVLHAVPVDEHDIPVDLVVTPERVLRVRTPTGWAAPVEGSGSDPSPPSRPPR